MPRLPRPVAFWTVAVMTTTVLLSSAAPSPLYPVYQQVFGFSAFTLTLVFAVYVVALVGTLLTVGSISDHIGRRPVLAASIVLLIVSMVVFVEADGVGMLLTARVLQGLATGALTGTASAALVDLAPTPRLGSMISTATPPLGLATGSVLAGVLVQYAPLPRELVYVVVGTALAVLLVTIVFLPETSPLHGFTSRRHLATTMSPSMSVPGEVRPTFFAAAPAMMATWSLGGLYLSLGSSIAAKVLGVSNHAAAGAILFSFFGSAAVSAALGTRLPSRIALTLGYGALGAGVLVSMRATLLASAPLYVVGSVVAGTGFGTTMLGVMTNMATATAPGDRGRVFAAVFALSYTAFSVPAVVAGVVATHVGLTPTAVGYALFIVGLVVLAAGAAIILGRRGVTDESAAEDFAEVADCVA
ncbi:MFS transporter [Williamsia deligens]|uniref:MFS transporter n=1 Tax=Williamsia deligens TaxID=321325 RepID=A0ABW3GBI1_9NOCA|nr:MFS transporter [Williamsia deligens]MCP2193152.1 putative arabinose efflux permease, MFS family [Williamsia deligens]